MTPQVSPQRGRQTLADWLALDPHSRREALAEARRAAETSVVTHGAYISVVGGGALQHQLDAVSGRPWAGVAVAVKDNIDVAGFVTTGGTSYLRGTAAKIDAGAVGRARHLGAVVIGKTNLHELALGVTSNNRTYGPVRNPVDPTRSAGGSSGGSAAAVATGTVPLAFGTDTGGSVSVPAAYCGVAGFRPTAGRYPGDGLLHLSWTRDTVGMHANTVSDLRLADVALVDQPRGSGAPAPGELTLGMPGFGYEDLDPGVAKAMQQALRRLEAAGAALVELKLQDHLERSAEVAQTIIGWEAPRSVLAHLHRREPPIRDMQLADVLAATASQDVAAALRALLQEPVTASAYQSALEERNELRFDYASALNAAGVQAAIFPSSPVLAPPLGLDDTVLLNGRHLPVFHTVIRHTEPGTVMGAPMVTLPAGTADGMPVGLTLQGHFFDDQTLLAVGESVEAVLSGG